ncbi:hypothetical protein HJC99_01525 [Candidatus Saccharibacteria bacterium]|nr:hypothetical protein [Candidatus Saccharibacteria bacterium]
MRIAPARPAHRPFVRFILAAAAAVSLTLGLSACSPDTSSVGKQEAVYACNGPIKVNGQPVSWINFVTGMQPAEVGEAGFDWSRSDSTSSWAQLVRLRNGFAGDDATILPIGTTVMVPKVCSAGESPATSSTTVSVPPQTSTASN